MACHCGGGGSCGPCKVRSASGMGPHRADANFPHNFPSVKQATKASQQHSEGPAGVPHQPVATKSVQVPNRAMGQGEAVGTLNHVWEVPAVNWGSHSRIRWGHLITAVQSRFRQPLDLLSFRGDLRPAGHTDRVRRKNHAALDDQSYNFGQINEGDVVALARARASAAAKRKR